jgi:hypothetical protein
MSTKPGQVHPEWVRFLGLSQQPTHYATGFDYGATYDPSHLDALTDDTSAEGDVIGRLQLDFTLPPLESRQIVFTIGLYAAGASAWIAAPCSGESLARPRVSFEV